MAIYEVSAHPLRSGETKSLSPEQYAAHVLLAESLLRLSTTPLSGRPAELLAMAVVLQVNWQVEYNTDPYVLASRNAPTARTHTSWKNQPPLVDPRAQQLVDEALGTTPDGRFGPGLRSVRGPQT